eukprot:694704-Rhodomonas_salina.7
MHKLTLSGLKQDSDRALQNRLAARNSKRTQPAFSGGEVGWNNQSNVASGAIWVSGNAIGARRDDGPRSRGAGASLCVESRCQRLTCAKFSSARGMACAGDVWDVDAMSQTDAEGAECGVLGGWSNI